MKVVDFVNAALKLNFETSLKLGNKATFLFKPSNRKAECRGIILAELCKEIGIELPKDPMPFSERVSGKMNWPGLLGVQQQSIPLVIPLIFGLGLYF